MNAATRRLSSTIALDVRLQASSRLYAIGVVAAVIMGLAARWLLDATGNRDAFTSRALAAFYLMGVGGTSFMFAAATILMEKGQGTLAALRVSPLRQRDYVRSKVVTLTSFALLESAIVFVLAGGVGLAVLPVFTGIVLLAWLYSYVGMGLAAGHDSVTSFLVPWALAISLVAQVPLMHILGIPPNWAWYLVPTQAPVLLMLSAAEPLNLGQWLYIAVMGTASAVGAAAWCRRRFRQYLGLAED